MKAVTFVVGGEEVEPNKEDQMNTNNYWNKITVCKIDNNTIIVDRISWIIKQTGSIGQYDIDALGYPM